MSNQVSKFFTPTRDLSSKNVTNTWMSLKSKIIKINSYSGSKKRHKIDSQLRNLLNEQEHLKWFAPNPVISQ